MNAITATGLSKSYRLGQAASHDTLRAALTHGVRSLFKPAAGEKEPFWALKDVSFVLKEGDALGIIGRNGSGKSTLLKILSRITTPDEGEARIRGRVASLLEVGTGFHFELTGRENIFLNGAILGMSREEIRRKFDEIVAFAETEQFLDTPVKHYSSGMFVRLAFAVAAHLEPDILIVDEVLAVGDAAFQKKCMGKMGDVAQSGRTILFVSHNMAAIRTLCREALWLQSGKCRDIGNVNDVVNGYMAHFSSAHRNRDWERDRELMENENIRIRSARVFTQTGAGEQYPSQQQAFTVHSPLVIEFIFDFLIPEALFFVGYHLRKSTGECIFVSGSSPETIEQGTYRCTCKIPNDLLNYGSYSVHAYFVKDGSQVLFERNDILCFDVHDAEREFGSWLGEYPGSVRPRLAWEIERFKTDGR